MVAALDEFKEKWCLPKMHDFKTKGWRLQPWVPVLWDTPSDQLAFTTLSSMCSLFFALSDKTPYVGRAAVATKVGQNVTQTRAMNRLNEYNKEKFGRDFGWGSRFAQKRAKGICLKQGIPLDDGLTDKQKAELGWNLIYIAEKVTELFQYGGHSITGKTDIATLELSAFFQNFTDMHIGDIAKGINIPNPAPPMVCPPLEWTETGKDGGYLCAEMNPSGKRFLMRKRTKSSSRPSATLAEAVNYLQSVPFRINHASFAGLDSLMVNGREAAGLPGQPEPLPPRVEEIRDEKHLAAVKKEREDVRDRNRKRRGRRITAALTYNELKEYVNEDQLWFPHSCDFRGRVYDMPGRISTTGADYQRGFLEFAEGVPLGERGLFWLKVHFANCFGVDKVTFEDRAKWAEIEMRSILNTPLEEWRGWEDADKPFAALSVASELYQCLKMNDPTSFVSHIPVAMDGSCNGLQWLAALARCPIVGPEVNLIDRVLPGDIYQLVADRVNAFIESPEYRDHECAMAWRGHVTRKTVKRAVMTIPYGSTTQGRLQALISDGHVGLIDGSQWQNGLFLNKLIDKALEKDLGNILAIQAWLGKCAHAANKAGETLLWTSPVGTVVQHDYMKDQRDIVRCYAEDSNDPLQLKWSRRQGSPKMDTSKVLGGISPNFVHSLDAAHLQGTLLAMKDEGVNSFTAIHDSYAVHAAHVDLLHTHIREQFLLCVESEPLESFKAENEERIGIELPCLPPRGSMDVKGVLDSTYLFS